MRTISLLHKTSIDSALRNSSATLLQSCDDYVCLFVCSLSNFAKFFRMLPAVAVAWSLSGGVAVRNCVFPVCISVL